MQNLLKKPEGFNVKLEGEDTYLHLQRDSFGQTTSLREATPPPPAQTPPPS